MKRQQSRILVRNKTDYPDDEVKTIVKKVLSDLDCTDICVTFNPMREGWVGVRGHYREYWYPKRGEDRAQIRVSLPTADKFPLPYMPYARNRDQIEPFMMETWQEGLVAIVAHEGMHHRQTPRNGYGTTKKRGRYVESECDQAAARYVRYYREDQS